VLHEPRFADLAPAEVYATLLDAGQHLSERTMYRVLAAHQEVRERRQQLRHPRYAAPELLANVGRLGWFPKRCAEAVSRATPDVVNDWPSTSFWRAPNHDVDE
jgi:hypothetical protein